MRWLRALIWIVAAACASAPPSPFFGDEKYLRFGVEPDTENKAVIEDHKSHGQRLGQRVDGEHFTALEFVDDSGQPVALRVITVRGIALALDIERKGVLLPSVRYRLLPAPFPNTHDADRDGFEELFIARDDGKAACISVYRVRDIGTVDPVEADAALFGQTLCAMDVVDIDGDGRAELVAQLDVARSLLDVWATARAQLSVPLSARDHGFAVDSASAAYKRSISEQIEQRSGALAHARQTLDVGHVFDLAIELAALAKLQGQNAADQVKAFDTALRGWVLDAPQQEGANRLRAAIYERWTARSSSPEPRAARSATSPKTR